MYGIEAFYMYMPRNSSVLASLGSLESWIASYLVENYEDSFLCHGKITCSLWGWADMFKLHVIANPSNTVFFATEMENT